VVASQFPITEDFLEKRVFMIKQEKSIVGKAKNVFTAAAW
jgi:hypothetical protein